MATRLIRVCGDTGILARVQSHLSLPSCPSLSLSITIPLSLFLCPPSRKGSLVREKARSPRTMPEGLCLPGAHFEKKRKRRPSHEVASRCPHQRHPPASCHGDAEALLFLVTTTAPGPGWAYATRQQSVGPCATVVIGSACLSSSPLVLLRARRPLLRLAPRLPPPCAPVPLSS